MGGLKERKWKGEWPIYTLEYNDEAVYQGQWRYRKRHGYGVEVIKEWTLYEGEWKNDQREGKGRCIWSSGAVYEGEFSNNMRNGEGKYI